MTDMPMPQPDNQEEEPQGEQPMEQEGMEPMQEGGPAPEVPAPQAPEVDQTAPPFAGPPVDPVTDDQHEMELRDELEMQLMTAAIQMTRAVGIAMEGNDAKGSEQFAAAAQHLTQAAVLLAPQESVDDLAAGGVINADQKSQLMNTTTRGVRRKAGS